MVAAMAPNGKAQIDRSAIMKQFGAPRRALPRRPGSRSARLVDAATSLPNRIAVMEEMAFALNNSPDHVGMVLVKVSGLPDDAPEQAALGLNAAAARLRKALRPTDLVGRTGPDEVGAALWGLATPELVQVVLERVEKAFSEPVTIAGLPKSLGITVGIGTSAPGVNAMQALASARALVERARPLLRSA